MAHQISAVTKISRQLQDHIMIINEGIGRHAREGVQQYNYFLKDMEAPMVSALITEYTDAGFTVKWEDDKLLIRWL